MTAVQGPACLGIKFVTPTRGAKLGIAALASLAMGAAVGGCGASHAPGSTAGPSNHQATSTTAMAGTTAPTTTSPVTTPTTSTTTTTTTGPPTTPAPTTTSTTVAPTTVATAPSSTTTTLPARGASQGTFPAVVNQAMEQFVPAPPGLEAPDALPSSSAAISAQTTGLGGTDSVTLIATAHPEPVNSPAVAQAAAADPASDLGTFSTTAVGTPTGAVTHVQMQTSLYIATCTGASAPVTLAVPAATSCSSAQGPVVTFRTGNWEVQVQDLEGTAPPLTTAEAIASWLAEQSLPRAGEGLEAVTVPGSPSAGSVVECNLIWSAGSDVYQVSGRGNYLAAMQLAAAMAPWPRR